MGLDSDWFAGTGPPDYTDLRCNHDSSGASLSTNTIGSWISYSWGPCVWLVFLSNKRGGPDGKNIKDANYGYVYGKKDVGGDEQGLHYIQHPFRSAPAISANTDGEMARPFADGNGSLYDDIIVTVPTGGSGTTSIWLYQPYAWYGRVGQVIAAVMLNHGLGASYFDQPAFSDADDGQAAMGVDDDDEPYVFFRRELGQTLGEAIMQLSLHSWDILSIGMSGKIGLFRRVSPDSAFVITSLDDDDGVVSVQWRYAYERLVNHLWACEGRYYEYTTEDLSGSHSDRITSCAEIEFPGKTYGSNDMPFEEFSDAASITKYGERAGRSRDVSIQSGNEVKKIRYLHFPYMCNIEADPSNVKATLMARLSDVESQMRREVTVVQDFRGLDYDVGWTVEDVAITADGVTIDAMVCIKKTINFKDFTVTSVLLEEPS